MPDFSIGCNISRSQLPIEGQPMQLAKQVVDAEPAERYVQERIAAEEELSNKDIGQSEK